MTQQTLRGLVFSVNKNRSLNGALYTARTQYGYRGITDWNVKDGFVKETLIRLKTVRRLMDLSSGITII